VESCRRSPLGAPPLECGESAAGPVAARVGGGRAGPAAARGGAPSRRWRRAAGAGRDGPLREAAERVEVAALVLMRRGASTAAGTGEEETAKRVEAGIRHVDLQACAIGGGSSLLSKPVRLRRLLVLQMDRKLLISYPLWLYCSKQGHPVH